MAQRVGMGELRKRLAPLMDQVERDHDHVIVTRNGRDSAVLLSAAEHEALMFTLEVLDDSEAVSDLAAGRADIKAGRLYDWEEAKAARRRLRA
jgi:prevent-host-death family protein